MSNHNIPPGLKQSLEYPLFDAILNRRSRRFGLGMSLQSNAIGFDSPRASIPLDKMEEALLIWAATGLTGSQLGDLPPRVGIGLLVQSTGRTWPTSCNNQGTELFYTNDDGTYMVKLRDLKPEQKRGLMFDENSAPEEKLEIIMEILDKVTVKLYDGRADMPKEMPGIFDFNAWNTNKPGTTLFMPVTNMTIEYINLLFLYTSPKYGFKIVDELHGGRLAGLDNAMKKGWIKDGITLPLMDLEMRILSMLVVEQAFLCQNINLALQALGLGGWTFTGFVAKFMMGGSPNNKGLGFRFVTPKKGLTDPPQPVPVGIDGVYEIYAPPYYKNMDEAVDAFLADKEHTCVASACFNKPDAVYDEVKNATPERIQVVKDVCNYIYDTYGRFPAFIDPMYSRLTAQAHHLETEFYDKHYPDGTYTETHKDHFKNWHPDMKNPFEK